MERSLPSSEADRLNLDRSLAESCRLSEEVERCRRLLDSAPLALWSSDADGKLTECNRGCEEYVGLSREEMVAGRWWTSVHPDDLPSIMKMLESARCGDPTAEMELRLRGADGRYRWFLSRCRPICDEENRVAQWVGSAMDIEDRRLAEAGLRRQNAALEIASDGLAQLLFEHDPNRTVAKLFARVAAHVGAEVCVQYDADCDNRRMTLNVSLGLPPEATGKLAVLAFGDTPCGVIAETRTRLVSTDIQTTSDPTVDLVRALGMQCYAGVPLLVGERLLGTLSFASSTRTSFSDDDLEFLNLIARSVAIAMERAERESERLRAVEAMRRARDEAEAANRSKDQFLAMLSHELRTPLTPVLGAISALEGEAALPDGLREDLAMIRRNVEMEASLINDLLDVTCIRHGKMKLRCEPVDVHVCVRDAVEICAGEARAKKIDLVLDLQAAEHTALADPVRLRQVFWNLVRNAVKFTPERGSIRCSSRNRNGCIRVEVVDTGIGIEPEMLPRIFGAFEQGTHRKNERFVGLGLGLSIAKGLMDMHGGRLSAFSEGQGKGATFSVELETVDAEPADPRRPAPVPVSPPRSVPTRILLVDDHPDTLRILCRLLKRANCTVFAARTVRDALALAPEARPELVISDVGLPDGSGLEIMRQLKAQNGVRGIALSGYGTEDDIRQCREAGFDEHFTKPVDFPALLTAVRRLMLEAPAG